MFWVTLWPDGLSSGEAICSSCGQGATHRGAVSARPGADGCVGHSLPTPGGSGGAVFDFQGKKFHRGRRRALVVDNISSKNAISGLITKTLLAFPGSWRMRSDHRAYCALRRRAVRTPRSSPF